MNKYIIFLLFFLVACSTLRNTNLTLDSIKDSSVSIKKTSESIYEVSEKTKKVLDKSIDIDGGFKGSKSVKTIVYLICGLLSTGLGVTIRVIYILFRTADNSLEESHLQKWGQRQKKTAPFSQKLIDILLKGARKIYEPSSR